MVFIQYNIGCYGKFEKCTVAMLRGPCSQHITGNMARLNQPQSAIKSYHSRRQAVACVTMESPAKRRLGASVDMVHRNYALTCDLYLQKEFYTYFLMIDDSI